jgi:uncharacterized protein
VFTFVKVKIKLFIVLLVLGSTSLTFDSNAQDRKNEVNPNGFNVFYHDNGKISSEGHMRDGKPDGYWKNYHPNGNMKSEGNRVEFELDSLWKFYDENGILEKKINYKTNKREGVSKSFTPEGFLIASEFYVDDKREGEAFYYYETGELHKRVVFENDKIEGFVYEYDKSGRIITQERYSKGNLRSSEKINRYSSEKKKVGTWKEFYDNFQIKEEGYYVNGKKNGVFKFYKRDGKLDKMLMYNNGELVEDAEETVMLDIRTTYLKNGGKIIGGYKDGTKHGVFREYDDKDELVNSFIYRNGVVIGEGIINANGFMDGQWVHYFDKGEKKSEGEYKNGLKNGKWTFYFKNGKVEQTGFYINDEPDGEWNWFYANGSLLRKEFYRKGLEDGHSVEYDRDGKVITEGEYIDGNKEGEWFFQMGTHTQRGEYMDGRKHGVWIHYFNIDTKQVSFEGEFIDGNPHGEHLYYHENGKKKLEAYYQMGVKVGKWKRYDEDGLLFITIQYKNGNIFKIDGKKFELEELVD